jgi:hypothetical protein
MKHVKQSAKAVFIFADDITLLQNDGSAIPTVRSKISLGLLHFLVISAIKQSLSNC